MGADVRIEKVPVLMSLLPVAVQMAGITTLLAAVREDLTWTLVGIVAGLVWLKVTESKLQINTLNCARRDNCSLRLGSGWIARMQERRWTKLSPVRSWLREVSKTRTTRLPLPPIALPMLSGSWQQFCCRRTWWSSSGKVGDTSESLGLTRAGVA